MAADILTHTNTQKDTACACMHRIKTLTGGLHINNTLYSSTATCYYDVVSDTF